MKYYYVFFLLLAFSIQAADSLLSFSNKENEQRYYRLIEELRCPKCLNQSIADSNAGISEDLRNIVYEKIEAGKSDREIKLFLKERYGDFILYQPEVGGANLILWFAPVLLMLGVIVTLLLRYRQRVPKPEETQLSVSEVKELEQLLDENNKEDS